MASDNDYMDFLNKANQDPSQGYAAAEKGGSGSGNVAGKGDLKAQDTGVEIPKAIAAALEKDGGKLYVSDADEPFVGVALKWDESGKGLPDEVEFAELIHHSEPSEAGVELMDPIDWDSEGQYADVVEAVREAGKGNDVRVYSVPRGGVRTEYWVVTTEGKSKDAVLVGAKALAVES